MTITASTVHQAEVEYRMLPDYLGYRFGSDGSVWSCWKRIGLGRSGGSYFVLGNVWRKLKPIVNEGGYYMVNIRHSSGIVKRNRLIHQLILQAFGFPRPSPRHECCHNDGVKSNNHKGNLRWGTRRSNAIDSVRHGTWRNGSRVPLRIDYKIKELLSTGITRKAIAKTIGVSLATVCRAIRRIHLEN